MGQYFKFICEETKEEMSPYDYNSLSKQIEHGWLENPYVMAVEGMLTPHGRWARKKMMYVGDYTDIENKKGESIYNKDNNDRNVIKPAYENMMDIKFYYLVNENKSEYVDKRNCPENDGWIVHPLGLLLAARGDDGGGDYHDKKNKYYGSWFNDRVTVRKTLPKDCKEIKPNFKY